MRPKTDKEIDIMREAGKMLATVLDRLQKQLQPGMSTKDLSDISLKEIKSLGARPAFLDHEGFPEPLCVSINEEIVHGLPKASKIVKDGDLVKLDFGVKHRNLVVDGAISVVAGSKQPSADVKRLIEGTQKSLMDGVDAISGDGAKVGDISAAVQEVLDSYKLGIIRDLVGHGLGDEIHEQPNIPNYGVAGTGAKLTTGMTIAVEPMAALGDWHISVAKDGWTVIMQDGSLGAHFEHTLVITEKGAEILTTL